MGRTVTYWGLALIAVLGGLAVVTWLTNPPRLAAAMFGYVVVAVLLLAGREAWARSFNDGSERPR